MNPPFTTELQRLRNWQGQLLKSRDFRDQVSYNALLQAWHNRALHTPYGVRAGFDVDLDENGEAAIIVPGVAFDAYGRELVMAKNHRIPLPEEIPPEGLYLVVSRQTISESGKSTKHNFNCPPDHSGQAGALGFSWEVAYRYDARKAVALGRLLPGPAFDPEFFPPTARPEAQPRRFYSDTLEGNTPWQIWQPPEPQATLSSAKKRGNQFVRFLGLEVNINTAAAGFTQTPCYFAWLTGDLWSPDLPGEYTSTFAKQYNTPQIRTLVGVAAIQLLAMRFGHIAEPTPNSFIYRIWFPQAAKWIRFPSGYNVLLALARQGRLTLNWLGIQMDRDIKENYGFTG